LREHREDIPELASQILSRFIESGEVSLKQFSTAALNALRNHDWPGNLAQLTGVIHSLALTCTGDELTADDVKQILASSSPLQSVAGIPLDLPLREARDMFEKTYFEQLIDQESGNMTRVAERAGLERTHLYRKLKLLGIKLRNH
jgi:DNA-binding NtrC family response regulator